MTHKYPPFYGVYLLQSTKKPLSCYVGSTPNPFRRIRQHNGDLKAGGAWRTKKAQLRPWNMLLIVNGFPSKIAALKFEHALQHPNMTRLISTKDIKRKVPQKARAIGTHLAFVRLLVRCSYFRRMHLKITFFRSHAHQAWEKNEYDIGSLPPQFQVETDYPSDEAEAPPSTVGSGELDINNKSIEEYLQKCRDAASGGKPLTCYLTEETLDVSKGNVALCHKCDGAFDVAELAERFLDEEIPDEVPFTTPSRHVIPIGGYCPSCSTPMEWSKVIKGVLAMRPVVDKGSQQ
ncbi:Structure-specific endonuclease subunit SLX1 [Yarrowia sp. C11]|nr:Structure-specific endonuclease subunit SLX1 [Yarrowia sp. C11]KAG5364208.1 Structure-specific endonuclease subunit SLX1 [Yarrowia sp. E02]